MTVYNLDEAESYLKRAARDCPCGSGGGIACDDWCSGDAPSFYVLELLKFLVKEVRDLRGEKK